MNPGHTDFIHTEQEPRVHWAHAHREGDIEVHCFMQTGCRGKKLF